jgi:hypothetical protein
VRYLFRGLMRESGRPVEGHVEASLPDEALKALSDNAIVTESLTPDPRPLNLNEELPDAPELANALDSAFDASSTQVSFDDLTDRYRGKKVWVIDRDKIRRRVCQVVDQSLAQSAETGESALASRQRVQAAIQGMFADNRNIASERNADTIPGYRAPAAPAPPALPPPPVAMAPQMIAAQPVHVSGLESSIQRLSAVVAQAEKIMASLALAARNIGRGGGGGGGGGGGRRRIRSVMERAQNDVLLEIFKANLDLARAVSGAPSANGEAVPEVPAEASPATEVPVGAEAMAPEPMDEEMAMAPDTEPEPAGSGASDGDSASSESMT